MIGPCILCRKPCGADDGPLAPFGAPAPRHYPAVVTYAGRMCSPCYQAIRDAEAAPAEDVRRARRDARALGFRIGDAGHLAP